MAGLPKNMWIKCSSRLAAGDTSLNTGNALIGNVHKLLVQSVSMQMESD